MPKQNPVKPGSKSARMITVIAGTGIQTNVHEMSTSNQEIPTNSGDQAAIVERTEQLIGTLASSPEAKDAIAEGREIATTHSLQNANRFSYTFPNQPWTSAQWLFSLTAYSIHQLTGVSGLILIKIAVFLFIILLLIKILQPRMPNQFVLILLLILFILSVYFRIMIRAHLFSILFFTLFLFLVDRYRTGKHRLSLLVTFNNAILVQFPFRISLWFWIARPC